MNSRLHLADELCGNVEIAPDMPLDEIPKQPFPLPEAFAWTVVDIGDAQQLKELYTSLSKNYVEDDDSMFRFNYSPEFLLWALMSPGWRREWNVGVRAAESGKLVAFIAAIPIMVSIYGL